ncbi:MAG: hypothetical protein U0V72_01570 [Cytophagales bacterium]
MKNSKFKIQNSKFKILYFLSNLKQSSIYLILFMVWIVSCKNKYKVEPESSASKGGTEVYNPNADNVIQLGKKIDNPYALKNMRKAYSSLARQESLDSTASPVHVSHYYVRFLPENWAQYDTLVADTSLELYNIPLDYEVAVCGNFYHDPSIPADKPTWQYTSVPVNFKFNSNIKYEILEELYIPETDVTLKANARKNISNKSFTNALLDEAMILTKNYDDTLKTNNTARTNWNPNGFVKVTDTKLNKDIPLEGVKIRCRRWVFVKVREATTNADGWYQTEGFDRPVNYSLIFETNNFDIRSGTFGQATVDGPKSSSPWNITFYVDDVNRFYAHVFRGAFRYHYKDIGGLMRPQNAGFKIKYAAYDKRNSDGDQGVNIGVWSYFGTNPNILIYRYGENGQYESDEIFSTTIHETCHTTHVLNMNLGQISSLQPISYNLGYVQYSQVGEDIAESWPVAVEWYITSKEYRERGITDYGKETYNNYTRRKDALGNLIRASYPLDRGYQYWNKSVNAKYSSIFIDLVDNFNQSSQSYRDENNNSYIGINDPVSGYSLPNIEATFLKYVYGASSLREQCKKNKPTGVSDTQIDVLLNNL